MKSLDSKPNEVQFRLVCDRNNDCYRGRIVRKIRIKVLMLYINNQLRITIYIFLFLLFIPLLSECVKGAHLKGFALHIEFDAPGIFISDQGNMKNHGRLKLGQHVQIRRFKEYTDHFYHKICILPI